MAAVGGRGWQPITAQRSFALAKNAGPGSIAHEWFHAFDHYIAQKCFKGLPRGMFASTAWLAEAPPIPHPLNQRLMACFKTILLTPNGSQPSLLFQRSVEMDKKMGQIYYSKPEELCARAFEAFVQDAPIKNHFLVKGTKATPEAELGLYPQGSARQHINEAFYNYFSQIGLAISRSA